MIYVNMDDDKVKDVQMYDTGDEMVDDMLNKLIGDEQMTDKMTDGELEKVVDDELALLRKKKMDEMMNEMIKEQGEQGEVEKKEKATFRIYLSADEKKRFDAGELKEEDIEQSYGMSNAFVEEAIDACCKRAQEEIEFMARAEANNTTTRGFYPHERLIIDSMNNDSIVKLSYTTVPFVVQYPVGKLCILLDTIASGITYNHSMLLDARENQFELDGDGKRNCLRTIMALTEMYNDMAAMLDRAYAGVLNQDCGGVYGEEEREEEREEENKEVGA